MTSTTLTTLFGEHPDVRVLEFLADNADSDFTLTELARNARVSRPATYKVVDRLLRRRVLRRTRRVGTSWFYALATDNPIVKPILPARANGRRKRAAPQKGVRA